MSPSHATIEAAAPRCQCGVRCVYVRVDNEWRCPLERTMALRRRDPEHPRQSGVLVAHDRRERVALELVRGR